jgi:pimeloyl-ACP methyl ester carboxylesterase
MAAIPTVPGVESTFVDLPEFRAHVAVAGAADGTPVLLLHGWPQNWYMWRHVLEALGPEHRLIAPDLRGFGWSSVPDGGFDPETFAADQIALLDALGIERVRVAGHDWGGFATFLLGLAHPERIERALVFNAPHPWPRRSPALLTEIWRSWYAVVNATPLLGRLSVQMSAHILTHGNVGEPWAEDEVAVYAERFRDSERAGATAQLYRSYLRSVVSGIGGRGLVDGRLTVPTRLVFGMRDRWVSSKLLPGWESHADDMVVEEVPDIGHFSVSEKPELAVERVRELAAA